MFLPFNRWLVGNFPWIMSFNPAFANRWQYLTGTELPPFYIYVEGSGHFFLSRFGGFGAM